MEVPVSLSVVPYACIAFSEIYIKVLLNIIKVSCMFYIYPCVFCILLWHGFPETCRDDVDFSFPSYWFWHMWQDIASKYEHWTKSAIFMEAMIISNVSCKFLHICARLEVVFTKCLMNLIQVISILSFSFQSSKAFIL